ncbi:MAG: hypothetical protein ABL921_01745 [Pirellula sp.]
MPLVHKFIAVTAVCCSIWMCDPRAWGFQQFQQAVPARTDEVASLLDGLSNSNYRVRREAFLKLCDRSLNIDEWLSKETKSSDRYRSAVAQWLIRLRQSSGSPKERLEVLQDLESLKRANESVLQRYVSQGKWEQLLELCGLLDSFARRELFAQENRVEWLVDQAWKSNNESFVPRFLNLTLSPSDRVHANLWWRKLGMPEEWKVDEPIQLPSVQVLKLEAEGKIDEAVDVAKKSRVVNLIEGLLLRSNRWDEWMALDTRRIPIMGQENFYHQKAGVLLTLGRIDEAKELLEKSKKGIHTPSLAIGDALLALATDRMEEYEAFVHTLPTTSAFSILRARGEIHSAFTLVGLDDLSIDSVKSWLKSKHYEKLDLADDDGVTSESALIDVADLFFQIGYLEQGKLLDDYVIAKTTEQEAGKGAAAWTPLLRQWRLKNDRNKAIKHWTEFLMRDRKKSRTARWYSKLEPDDSLSPFVTLYPDFPLSVVEIYEYLCRYESGAERGDETAPKTPPSPMDTEAENQIVSRVVMQLEDLNFGRMPIGWKSERRLEGIRQYVISRSKHGAASMYSLGLELADMFGTLGESQLALETLDLLPSDKNVNLARAKHLKKLGEFDAASSLLLDEFAENTTDLPLLLECTECLELAGRFDELDRVRIQGLSSVSNNRIDAVERSMFNLPVRREAQMILEQFWLRVNDVFLSLCLARQFNEASKEDISQAPMAARFARLELIDRIKHYWPNEKFDLAKRQYFFLHGFTSYALDAIVKKDRNVAEEIFRMVHRCAPQDIDFPIAVVPAAERAFGKELADDWFDLYYQPMLAHSREYPHDTLIGNNTAWLAACCGRELETAKQLASRVVASDPIPTYLDTLAEIEYRLGNIERSIELSEKCRQSEPKEKHHRQQLKRFRAGESR